MIFKPVENKMCGLLWYLPFIAVFVIDSIKCTYIIPLHFKRHNHTFEFLNMQGIKSILTTGDIFHGIFKKIWCELLYFHWRENVQQSTLRKFK